jgi:copper oxidase (laccase) domain-containing protein
MIVYNFLGKNCLLEKNLQNQQPFVNKLQELNINYHKICFLNQVHGNEVIVIDSQKSWQDLYQNSKPRADALVSNQKNIVFVCLTLFF